jgi:hypothetical protein
MFLFDDGSSEELNSLQVGGTHSFPQHFCEMKRKVVLVTAPIISTKGSNN